MNQKLANLLKNLEAKTPKQVRTLRNQLNNRIQSFEDELKSGKKLGKISESHPLFDLNLGECKAILQKTLSALKTQKQENHSESED